MRRTIVVGASRGIGEALVRALVAAGDEVVAVARGQADLDALAASLPGGRCHVLVHDVTSLHEVPTVFQAAERLVGEVDAVIYNAGVMPVVGAEQYDAEIDRQILTVNLLGAVAWLDEAARRFHLRGNGTIVGIGSVAGDRGRAGNPAYNTSKAGLHTFLEALRNRLDKRGVRVVTIKPGPVDTAMMQGRPGMPLMVKPEVVASRVVAAMGGGAQTVYVHGLWWPIMTIIRLIPSWIFRRVGPP